MTKIDKYFTKLRIKEIVDGKVENLYAIAVGLITVGLIWVVYSISTGNIKEDNKKNSNELKQEYQKIQKKIEKKKVQIDNVVKRIEKLQSIKNLRLKEKRKLINTKKCLENMYPVTLKEDKVDVKGCFKS